MKSYILTCFIFCVNTFYVRGYPNFQNEIPNGDRVPDPCKKGATWQGVGHLNPNGGGERNPFGKLFKAAGNKWTGWVCDTDSDGDGITNGMELGDPFCEWSVDTTPRRTSNISHPGICEPVESDKCRELNSWLTCPKAEKKQFCPAMSEPGVKYFDMKIQKTKVPARKTTYMCQRMEFSEGDYHMIGSKPLIDNADITHHILVFGCSAPNSKTKLLGNSPYRCGMTPGPDCQEIIATWTVGSEGDCSHKDVGFRIGSKGFKFLALQVHWNNPSKSDSNVDGSGLRIYYTSNLRTFDSAILTVGQEYLEIPPEVPSVTFNSSCLGMCTETLFKEPIYITRALNHMHYRGRQQTISLYRNGNFVKDLTNEKKYNYDSPKFYRFDPPIKILPGDEIRTLCTYSSIGINETIYYGDGTNDEMCYGFITYYPKQDLYTPFCTDWKSVSKCKRYHPSLDGVYNNCKWWSFLTFHHNDSKTAMENINMHCKIPNVTCSTDCLHEMESLKKHPCLQGDLGEFIRFRWRHWKADISELMQQCKSVESSEVKMSESSTLQTIQPNKAGLSIHVNSAVSLFIVSLLIFSYSQKLFL